MLLCLFVFQNITSPANPHIMIMSIGWILYSLVPMNANRNIIMLDMNRNVLSVGEPKFSGVASSSAAAAMSPTIAGRSPLNMLVTNVALLCLMRNLLMVSINTNGSHMTLMDASMAPMTASHVGYPAFMTVV